MLRCGKTEAVRAFVTARSARSQDADLYRRYAAALYRQALLTRGDPVLAERVSCDVIVNEAALARISEHENDPGCGTSMSRAAVADPRSSRRKVMRTIGFVTTITAAAAGAALGLVAVKSLPDVRRYLTMKKM
jgi:hypothetical protein